MCAWRPVVPGTFTDVQVGEARGPLPLAQGRGGWVGEGEGAPSLQGPGCRQRGLTLAQCHLSTVQYTLPGPPRKGAAERGIPRDLLPPPTCQTW